MRVWFSNVFVHQPKELGAQKLGECGHPAKFLGYPEASAGYRTYDLTNHKVMIVHLPIFCEEACSCPNTTFKPPADDSDDDATDEAPTPSPPMDNIPHNASTPSKPPHIPSSTSQAHLACSQHAPPRFDPDSFGAHGHWKEAIANAHEDLINDALFANVIAPDLVCLVLSDAHLTESLGQINASLPDAPSLHEDLSGPKCDKWHSAVLEELAAIKDAGTWELVDYSPSICNIIGC